MFHDFFPSNVLIQIFLSYFLLHWTMLFDDEAEIDIDVIMATVLSDFCFIILMKTAVQNKF